MESAIPITKTTMTRTNPQSKQAGVDYINPH